MDNQTSADPAATRSRESCGCAIVGPKAVNGLMMKYLGLKPGELTNDEREILMFVLYQESVEHGGIGKTCTDVGDARLRAQGARDDETPQGPK